MSNTASGNSREPFLYRIRRWFRGRNIVSILLIAGLTILGYYIFQGEGVFVVMNQNQNPFNDNLPLKNPQDLSASTVILREDFSNVRGQWTFSPPNQSSFFGDGLLLEDNIYSGEAWAKPGLEFDDFVLVASSRWLGGSLGGGYGVRLRKDRTTGEYLALYLHNDGRFTIEQQTRRALNVHANKYNAAINTEGGINNIQIEISNNTVDFFVNEAYLGTFEGDLPAIGDVEFVAIKDEETDAYMAGFDNLLITHNFVESR
ncbi:MAG: hypothetical protein AAF902_13475 [Chloroflexota bacterium]